MNVSAKGFGVCGIRGLYPDVVNEELAYRVGRAFPGLAGARKIAVGHDIRLSGPSLQAALVRGLTEAGCDVLDIDLCGTEMIAFAVRAYQLDGGIMLTAGSDAKAYNGMTLMRRDACLLTGDTGLKDLEALVLAAESAPAAVRAGQVEKEDITEDYIADILSHIDLDRLKPFRVVANTGNGAAGPVINAIEKKLPFDIVKVNNIPDGNFPNGEPDPLLPENREATAKAILESEADLGAAWNCDFSRCILFDERGNCFESGSSEGGSSMLAWLRVMERCSQFGVHSETNA